MKTLKILKYKALLLMLILSSACSDVLDEEVFSQLSPGNFLTTQEGIKATLDAAYAEGYLNGYSHHSVRNIEEWCTDIEWETGGGENRTAVLMINFTWDASVGWMYGDMWLKPYRAIRNANVVLENVELAEIGDDLKRTYAAEARFIRALSYYYLHSWFGPVPIRQSSEDEIYLPRPSEEEIRQFIESELLAVIPDLPAPGEEQAYGRATNGGARALLTKFYLNTKQWQKAADMAEDVMEMGDYGLYPDYAMLFRVQNEQNQEFILTYPQIPNGPGNNYINGAFPGGFASDPKTGLTFINSWRNWAAQYRLYDSFYNSFEEGDKRMDLIIDSYVNGQGNTVSLLNNNNTRSFKYWPDPNGLGNEHGNDVPGVRYSDILLSRAEALNELNGPNQESIDLINMVRGRADLEDLALSDFTSTEELRTHLLNERAWEFYTEGKRREDQIRMGTFVSSAIDRGITNAKPTHVLFPIPQAALDANEMLVQNDGY
ncbi:RagB/SusD family nutrient uptake outer membrane protein [Echinicola marina]|uniref:RagB/SusD family nutrient uptake outer membrane protein n=1 Tax=Echinicola marina TaxID=2859768 RepID=UPI001CF6BD9A|nr:RagB/SusD family nutrient uptake outer membrane protein [Echinicola marina]UCS91735.1 RagB/SusD family nutrient uptake outer membrane protein [Echinicola marina]